MTWVYAIGVWVSPGPVVSRDVAGDHPDERAGVRRRQQRRLARPQVLVARVGPLLGLRQVHPQLHAVEQPAARHEVLGRRLDVQDPRAGGHPLGVAVGDGAPAAVRVLVLEDPVDHVGDGLEAAVRVPGRPLRLARGVLDLAHLVHVDERVEVGEVDAGERAAHGEPLALVALGRDGDRGHRAQALASRRRPRPGGPGWSGRRRSRRASGGLLGRVWAPTLPHREGFRRVLDNAPDPADAEGRHDAVAGRAGGAHARLARPVGRLPARREHPHRRARPLADRRGLDPGRPDLPDERDRDHPVAVARHLDAAGDAAVLLRGRVLEPHRLRRGAPPGRHRRLVRAGAARPAAEALGRVPRVLGRDRGRAAPGRRRRAAAAGDPRDRRRAAPRHGLPARDAAVRAAVVPRRLPGRGGDRAVDDRAAPPLPLDGDLGDARRRAAVGRAGVHGRRRLPVGERGVRAAGAAPVRALPGRRHARPAAAARLLGDGRRRARGPRRS